MSRPRKYPPELLDRAARVVFDSGRPIAHVAADLGLPSATLRKYVRQVEADEGRRPDHRPEAARERLSRWDRPEPADPDDSASCSEGNNPGVGEGAHRRLR